MSEMNTYQKEAWSYAMTSAKNPLYLFAGLAGEVGELNSLVAKSVRDGHSLSINDVVKEVGDVLWFVAGVCSYYNIPLQEVADKNLNKLRDRKARNVISGNGDNR